MAAQQDGRRAMFRSTFGLAVAATAGGPLFPGKDADLLSLAPVYRMLRAKLDAFKGGDVDWDDHHEVTIGKPFEDLCSRVLDLPPAETAAGLAFKAQLALEQHYHLDTGRLGDRAVQAVLNEVIAAGRA